jgi:hypothetical protein
MWCLTSKLKWVAAIILAGCWSSPVLAESPVTSAELYRVVNQVELNRQDQGQWARAAVGDSLVPRDAVRTAAQSRAEILFNEGTLVRTGEGTVFRFPPGRRSFELVDGSALFMIRPGQGDSRINTSQASVLAHGTALFVQHDASRNASIVGVLTNSPLGPVSVTNARGDVTVELQAGQFVSVIDGVIGLVETFLLPIVYQSVDLASGLGVGQESFIAQQSPAVQETINAVRAETLEPLANQVAWIQGFCSANVGTLQDVLQSSPLARLLLPSSIPPPQVTIQMPQSDLLVTPMRSLTGLLWLGNYCQNSPR